MKGSYRVLLLFLLSVTCSLPLAAGTYFAIEQLAAQVAPADPSYIGPFAIVHPPGYVGDGGLLEVTICVAPADPMNPVTADNDLLIGPTQAAIRMWNEKAEMVGNCIGCVRAEDPPSPSVFYDGPGILAHELGHCALGLDHPNLKERCNTATEWRIGKCDVDSNGCCGEQTSFTNALNVTEFIDNGTRGASDNDAMNQCQAIPAVTSTRQSMDSARNPVEIPDGPTPTCPNPMLQCPMPPPSVCCPACPGPECPTTPMQVQEIHWFRTSDNNPFAIDSTVIDMNTFSRLTSMLPSGQTYAANANRGVAMSLGISPETQSAMYTVASRGSTLEGLVADDVNMVRMGETGMDRSAGTADDYIVALRYQADCSKPEVTDIVVTAAAGSSINGAVGTCENQAIDLSFPQTGIFKFHYSLTPFSGQSAEVKINRDLDFDFGPSVFSAGFESGDLREWKVLP